MSDTPETDAACSCFKGYTEPLQDVKDLSRKLERERDQLKQLLAADSERVDAYLGVCIERDEAREKVEQQRKEINRLNGATNHAGGTPLKIALRERDEWAEMCGRYKQERDEALMDRANGDIATMTRNHYERILRERDEAREESQRLRVQLNHYTQANEMAEQAFRERDEAHKIAGQAIDDLAWFNETNAQRLRNELEQLKEETK